MAVEDFVVACDERTGLVRSATLYGEELLGQAGPGNAELLVNGKAVASQLFTWGVSPGERLYRLSFDWVTRGVPPGEYRIGAQAFVWEDSSPFDNRLDVTKTVVIAPAGGVFPGGEAAGGSATETDPRFGKSRVGG